jgi:hypothetical protein
VAFQPDVRDFSSYMGYMERFSKMAQSAVAV